MKKFFAGLVKLFTVLTFLAGVAYAAVLYWDTIEEFVGKLKSLVADKRACCCSKRDEYADDYADWDE